MQFASKDVWKFWRFKQIGGNENVFFGVFFPGWTGKLCDTELNECESSPCKNGGLCLDLHANYSCACTFGKNCSGEWRLRSYVRSWLTYQVINKVTTPKSPSKFILNIFIWQSKWQNCTQKYTLLGSNQSQHALLLHFNVEEYCKFSIFIS